MTERGLHAGHEGRLPRMPDVTRELVQLGESLKLSGPEGVNLLYLRARAVGRSDELAEGQSVSGSSVPPAKSLI